MELLQLWICFWMRFEGIVMRLHVAPKWYCSSSHIYVHEIFATGQLRNFHSINLAINAMNATFLLPDFTASSWNVAYKLFR